MFVNKTEYHIWNNMFKSDTYVHKMRKLISLEVYAFLYMFSFGKCQE